MAKLLLSKKNILLFILLFIVFISINTKWIWQLIYPIKYEEEIYQYTSQYDIDPFLVLSIIQVETRFDKDKISKKGAVGLMQIMPETAEWIIEHGQFSYHIINELQRPDVSIALGSWYLSKINKQFNNNLVTAIAAYNAGPGNVSRWLQWDIWDGTIEQINQIPFGETRHYIQRVLYFYDRYQWIYEDTF